MTKNRQSKIDLKIEQAKYLGKKEEALKTKKLNKDLTFSV